MAVNIGVLVVYALPQVQTVLDVEVPLGATVREAILASALLDKYPELDLDTLIVGVFNEKVGLDSALNAGDRIEIYRPLQIDPKDARRLRLKERA